MKKLFALVLAVLMIATMSTTAFAATVDTETTETITVTGTYQPGSGTPEDVISVDISWGSMAFTYTAGTQEWDPASHNYKDTAGTWTYAEGANKITIANHSNVKIMVEIIFTDNTETGINGWFYNANDVQVGAKNVCDAVTLPSAASDDWIGDDNAPTQTRYFKITEGAISADNTNLGTITLTISKPQ